MQQTISIHDAKTNLSKYIAQVKTGKTLFIGAYGNPEVMLTLVTLADLSTAKKRDFSFAKNKISEMRDSFSEETELEVAQLLTHSE